MGQAINDRDAAAGEFAAATVVFEGEVLPGGYEVVTPTQDKPGLGFVVFRVLRSYKGNPGDSIRVYDAMAGTDCAFQPTPGEKFFVYGHKGKDGNIYVESCSRTTTLDSAGADIRYARGQPPLKEDLAPPGEKWRLLDDPSLAKRGATVRGNVRRIDRAAAGDIFLTIWDLDEQGRRDDEIAATQKVNADGTYEVRFLPPGKYLVTAISSKATSSARYVGEYGYVSVAAAETVSHVNVLLRPNPVGEVKVRVIAPPELHGHVFVWLRSVDMDAVGSPPYAYAKTAELDNKDTATFDSVPFGMYDVYVMLYGDNAIKPSWTHDAVRVSLNGRRSQTVVKLRKAPKSQ